MTGWLILRYRLEWKMDLFRKEKVPGNAIFHPSMGKGFEKQTGNPGKPKEICMNM